MTFTKSFLVLLALTISIFSVAIALDSNSDTQAAGCPSILIVGASGYIGSYLFERLQQSSTIGCSSTVVGIDRHPVARMRSLGVHALHCANISDSLLSSANVVIYLGEVSSRNVCNSAERERVTQQNVSDVENLASRMRASQLLIFASSSAIADGLAHPANEQEHGPETSLDA